LNPPNLASGKASGSM